MVHLPSSPDVFQQHFLENRVALMASSPPGQSVQKYFFYAQQVHQKYCKMPNGPFLNPLNFSQMALFYMR